ncbi:MAG TPA: tRNA preQ1(34) S-adenosylmethionine ribosyltransferase-isomerase QueA [Candidatus Limnocylindria bacterium]|nr:tRNA preQ1(34) S-adenosylmethionine ribosyltransferase-isomerase QueA [Candidatus Limnocylindria bacterium]
MSGPSPERLAAFEYALPEDLIAQEPAPCRSDARLLVVNRARGSFEHRRIAELPDLLRASDLLVVNDARVVRARVRGRRPSGGRLELLLLHAVGGDEWEALVRGSPRVGERVELPDGHGEWTAQLGGGRWRLRLAVGPDVAGWLERVGELPLPPYIRRPGGPTPADEDRYQTVFATTAGAVAAPTAGLHFTPELLRQLEGSGIRRAALTLHVGPGTFLPIRDGELDTYTMEGERFELPQRTVDAIEETRRRGGRVVAVGTTTTRALEAAAATGTLRAGSDTATLFIAPGHRFQVVDVLLTNFHLPRTPLLALVAAFAGWPLVRQAYETAVAARYRFYSYGDAMLLT